MLKTICKMIIFFMIAFSFSSSYAEQFLEKPTGPYLMLDGQIKDILEEKEYGIDIDSINYNKDMKIIEFTYSYVSTNGNVEISREKIDIEKNMIADIDMTIYPSNGQRFKLKGKWTTLHPIEVDSVREKMQKVLYNYFNIEDTFINKTPKWVFVTFRKLPNNNYEPLFIDLNNIKKFEINKNFYQVFIKTSEPDYVYIFIFNKDCKTGYVENCINGYIMNENTEMYQANIIYFIMFNFPSLLK